MGSEANASGPFGLISNDGGATWSAPVDIGSHQNEPSTGHVTGVVSGGTPFLTVGCCGVLEIQQGFGPGAPTTPVPTAGETGQVEPAVDAATGEVVVGYQGNNVDSYMQGVAPGAAQSAQALPHPKSPKPWLVVAGRDSGPGVFAAYSTDDNHIRLARYGTSATVPVGAVPGHIPNSLGVATGIGGQKGTRSAPTIINRAYSTLQFWDGRAPSLEEQVKGPLHPSAS